MAIRFPWSWSSSRGFQLANDPILTTQDASDYGPIVLGMGEAVAVSHLWRAGNIIADSLGQVPLEAWRVTGDLWGDPLSPRVEVEPASTPVVFARPQPFTHLGRVATIQQMVWSLLIHGNVFVLVPAVGEIRELRVLDPDDVQIDEWSAGKPLRVFSDGVMLDEAELAARGLRVLHVPWVVAPDRRGGIGVLSGFGASALRIGAALNRYLSGSLVEGGMPSIVVKVNTPNLTEAEAESLKAKWMRKMAGRRVPAVVNSQVEVQPISMDSTLVEQSGALWNIVGLEVSNMTGIPANYLNVAVPGSSLNYTTLESRQRDLIGAVRPWASRLEAVFTECARQERVRGMFDLDGLARGETQARYQGWATALSAGFMTVDEVRAAENLPPLPAVDPEPAPVPALTPALEVVSTEVPA